MTAYIMLALRAHHVIPGNSSQRLEFLPLSIGVWRLAFYLNSLQVQPYRAIRIRERREEYRPDQKKSVTPQSFHKPTSIVGSILCFAGFFAVGSHRPRMLSLHLVSMALFSF